MAYAITFKYKGSKKKLDDFLAAARERVGAKFVFVSVKKLGKKKTPPKRARKSKR
jgi:hypothetical protein